MSYTLQHTQTKPKVTSLLSGVGRTDPSISNIYTNVSIGIGSILAWFLHWYFHFSSFLMFSIISVLPPFHQGWNIALHTLLTLLYHCSALLSCRHVTPRHRERQSQRQSSADSDAIIAHGTEETFYWSYFTPVKQKSCSLLPKCTWDTFTSIGFSIGINNSGLLWAWYWIDSQFWSVANHCC